MAHGSLEIYFQHLLLTNQRLLFTNQSNVLIVNILKVETLRRLNTIAPQLSNVYFYLHTKRNSKSLTNFKKKFESFCFNQIFRLFYKLSSYIRPIFYHALYLNDSNQANRLSVSFFTSNRESFQSFFSLLKKLKNKQRARSFLKSFKLEQERN